MEKVGDSLTCTTLYRIIESFVSMPVISASNTTPGTNQGWQDPENVIGQPVGLGSGEVSGLKETENLAGKKPIEPVDVDTSLLRMTVGLIEIAKSGGDMGGVEAERSLDSMAIFVKRKVKSVSQKDRWFKLTLEAMMKLAWDYHWEPKPQKKIIKVITEIERHDRIMVRQGLEPYTTLLKPDISREHLTKWYSFWEVSAVAREILDDTFHCIIPILNNQFGQTLREKQSWTMDRQKMLQLLLKVALQLFQYMQQRVIHSAWKSPDDNTTKDTEILVQYIVNIVASEDIPNHCLPLAGTALGFLVGLSNDYQTTSKAFIDVFNGLGQGKEISLGNLRIVPTTLFEDSTSRNSSHFAALREGVSLGHLNLLSGLLTCAKVELLCQTVDLADIESEKGTEGYIMVEWLFHIVVRLCNIPEHQYHSFKLLTSWYQRLTKCFPQLRDHTGRMLFKKNSLIVEKTLALVWTHLDSPVEGVNDSIMEAFRILLELNSLEKSLVNPTESETVAKSEKELKAEGDFPQEVLTRALTLPWTLKGKHCLIALLVKYTDCTQLVSFSGQRHLFGDLLDCLGTNHLAPASTLVYRAILHQLNPQGTTEGFKQHCLPWLIQGLMNENSLLRNNANHYWLSVTLKCAPETYPLIVNVLENPDVKTQKNKYLVHGLIAVLNAGRAHNLLKQIPKELLRQAFQHQDDDIRLDAFGVICVSQKKAEAVTPDEFDLLKEFLPHNMTNDNAPFRQQLQASLRAMLTRLRDSAIAFVRVNKSESTKETINALEFLDWFWSLLMESLFPGASYQRLKSALDWILLVLDTFTYQPHRRQRKGTTPETVKQLMNIAASHGLCNFYSPESVRLLLACLLHGTDEIRNMTAEVLLRFFPWPLALDYNVKQPSAEMVEDKAMYKSDRGCQLLQTGLRLCNSAKAHESESGALIVSMVFQKLVVGQGMVVGMSTCSGRFRVIESESKPEDGPATLHFLNQIIGLISESLEATRENVLTGAKQTPIHGFLLAIRKCLSLKCVTYTDVGRWRPVVLRLIKVVSMVYDLVLEVLGGKVHSKDTAPSFEQMGIAIAATIAESTGEDTAEDMELLTNDHRVLMTWGWVNIKTASILLSSLIEFLPLSSPSDNGVLNHEEVVEIGNTFLKILTQCRHRGAIEGCNIGLAQYCEHLLLSSASELHAIPGVLLDQVLGQITRSDINVSVTRRSAGLPLIITSIVNSESKTRQSVLLHKVVTTLLSISGKEMVEGDQRADMPQVHAMNILKAIMKEASVAMAARKYLAQSVILAIDGFASPHWAVRNAAMQLFGTLVTRMLGQKHTRDCQTNLMTVPEFFAHYPTLEEYFLTHLEVSAAYHQPASRSGLHLHPTTFPVLSIFARLGSGTGKQNQHSEDKFRAVVRQFLSSAVLAVREMAAQSLVGLTPVAELKESISEIIQNLPLQDDTYQANRVHGNMLLCHHYLKRLRSSEDGFSDQYIGRLLDELATRSWLVSPDNQCTILRAQYMELIMYLTAGSNLTLPTDLEMPLHSSVQEMIFSDSTSINKMVGRDRILMPLIQLYLGLRGQKIYVERVLQCLTIPEPDILIVTLTTLSKHLDEFPADFQWTPTQTGLWKMLLSDPHCTLACALLDALISIYERFNCLGLDHKRDAVWIYLMGQMSREKNSLFSSKALYMTAVILSIHLPKHLLCQVGRWRSMLTECHHPINAEILHISTAKSLAKISEPVVRMLRQAEPSPIIIDLAIGMFDVGVKLLVNESSQVRRAAADFITYYYSELNNRQSEQPLQPTLAVKILYDVTFKLLPKSPTLICELISEIRRKRPITELIDHEAKPYVEELFEAEEANYYKEDVTLTSLFSHHMQNYSLECISVENTEENMGNIIKNLSEAEPYLRKNCSSEGPINVSFVQRVYECIWAELHVASVLVHALPQDSKVRSQLKDLLQHYSSMQNLHTHLLELVDRISITI